MSQTGLQRNGCERHGSPALIRAVIRCCHLSSRGTAILISVFNPASGALKGFRAGSYPALGDALIIDATASVPFPAPAVQTIESAPWCAVVLVIDDQLSAAR